MNRLDRFRFGNLHKRRIFGVIVIFVLIAFVSAAFLTFLGFFGSRSDLPRISISANNATDIAEGVGFNILDIPDSNIIEDPFFESRDNCIFATVYQADGNCIYFEPSEGSVFDELESYSEVSILSIDAEGEMGLRFSSSVSGYDSVRFGVPVSIKDSHGIWNSDSVIKVVENNGVVYALTESGVLIQRVIYDSNVAVENKTFVDICSSGNYVYALSDLGEVYMASEGGNFTYACTFETTDDNEPLYITAVNGSITAFFNGGEVKTLSGVDSFTTSFIDASYVESNSSYVVAVDKSNQVYFSSNGIFFNSSEGVSELLAPFDYVIDVEIYDSRAYILTNYGKLLSVELTDGTIDECDISSIEPVGICSVNENYVIAVANDNQAYVTDVHDGTNDSLGIGNTVVEDIFRFGDNKFIIASGSSLYETSLMSALILSDSTGSSIVERGDICMVKTSSVDTDAWSLQGDTLLDERTGGVTLTGTGDGIHAMSRRLDQVTSELFEDGVFYRIDVAMTSSEDLHAYVWLEGDYFGQQGMQVTVTESNADVYSFVFAVTENMIDDEHLRFNIAFEDEGSLYIDYVYVGPSNSDINSIPSNFRNCIVHNNPSVLRFQSLLIGGSGYCEETFYGVHAESAESALLMCRDANANPWFVLGSQITQSDIDNFLGYLCGSVTSDYGKLRIDNGTALPWSRQFNTFYIEILDSEGAYLSDVQRAAYVNYVMTLFERSSYYIEIKDRIVFIDGMNYVGGVVYSSADRHSSTISVDSPITSDNSFADCVSEAVEEARFNAPRSVSGEYISSICFDRYEGSYTAADVVSSIIEAQSSFADIILFDSDTDVFNTLSSLSFLAGSEQMYYEVLDPVELTSELTAENFSQACDIMLLNGDSCVYLIVTNHSESAQQFLIQSSVYDVRNGSYARYSSEGDLLIQREINRFGSRQYLQPGEYMVISVTK